MDSLECSLSFYFAGKKKNRQVQQQQQQQQQQHTSWFASSTLAKAAFLCSVLLEEPDCHHLAFRVGLFGLEMPRSPAASKALDVSHHRGQGKSGIIVVILYF